MEQDSRKQDGSKMRLFIWDLIYSSSATTKGIWRDARAVPRRTGLQKGAILTIHHQRVGISCLPASLSLLPGEGHRPKSSGILAIGLLVVSMMRETGTWAY